MLIWPNDCPLWMLDTRSLARVLPQRHRPQKSGATPTQCPAAQHCPRRTVGFDCLGQDRIALYLAGRLRSDLSLFLTDCAVAEFFEEYDKSKQSTSGERAEASASEQRGNVSFDQTEMLDTFLLRGKAIYASQCGGCHGEAGNGQGMLTLSWLPRPRNFVHGSFRYRSTPSGSPPTDADLFRTVSKGLAGSGMPAFEAILSEQERRDVVAYIKQFSQRFAPGSEPSSTSVSARRPR